MKRALYLDTTFGISGDMTAGALIDLGADSKALVGALHSLPLDGYEIVLSQKEISGLSCVDFDVVTADRRDHDMEYLYARIDTLDKGECLCSRDLYHDKHHHHRGIKEIREIIDSSILSPRAKENAYKVFNLLSIAEARVHGVEAEEVHFHEAGAVDSIVDIAAVAWCLDYLDIENIIVRGLSDGTGFVRCQHGVIPVPVPAVVEIARLTGLKLSISEDRGEYVTPTGAAVAGALRTSDTLPESFFVEAIGLGAGKRVQDRPGLLRALLINFSPESA